MAGNGQNLLIYDEFGFRRYLSGRVNRIWEQFRCGIEEKEVIKNDSKVLSWTKGRMKLSFTDHR